MPGCPRLGGFLGVNRGPQEVRTLISRTCESDTFADTIEVTILRGGDYPGLLRKAQGDRNSSLSGGQGV